MSESGYPPVPPVDPTQPPAEGGAATAPPPAPPKRSRAWMWWTLGILVVILGIVLSCTLPFVALFSESSDTKWSGGMDAVAVIRMDGVIAGTGDYYSGVVTPEYFLDLLEQAEEDSRVKAIVLRVDSPGGTVAASEEIAEYVKRATKPVIISIGDVGASGAYMVSSQADEIWAVPGSSVGSIGVIAQIPNVEGLLDTIGVEFQTITAGELKDTGSPYRPLTKEEQALIKGQVEEAYDQFIGIVAEGRKLDRAEVEKLATGWTWSGERAKELGLVDQIGTYKDALDSAAKKGGIDGEYDVVTYEEDFGELFGSLFSLSRSLDDIRALTSREATLRGTVPR